MTWRSRLALFIIKANASSKPCHPSCTVDVFQITRTPSTPLRNPTTSFLSSRTLASSSPRNGSSGRMSPRRCLLALLLSSVFSVSGDIFVKNQLKVLVKVGSVDFQQDDSQGNPVLAHLQRHGTPLGLTTPLANEGYSLTNRDISTAFNAPLTNEPYLKISADFNSIHINPYSSDFASLPATITHDLWSSAATRRYIGTVVAKGHPDRVITYVFSRAMFVLPNGHSRRRPRS